MKSLPKNKNNQMVEIEMCKTAEKCYIIVLTLNNILLMCLSLIAYKETHYHLFVNSEVLSMMGFL